MKKQGVAKVGVDFQGVNAGGMNESSERLGKKAEHKPQEFILTPQDFSFLSQCKFNLHCSHVRI